MARRRSRKAEKALRERFLTTVREFRMRQSLAVMTYSALGLMAFALARPLDPQADPAAFYVGMALAALLPIFLYQLLLRRQLARRLGLGSLGTYSLILNLLNLAVLPVLFYLLFFSPWGQRWSVLALVFLGSLLYWFLVDAVVGMPYLDRAWEEARRSPAAVEALGRAGFVSLLILRLPEPAPEEEAETPESAPPSRSRRRRRKKR